MESHLLEILVCPLCKGPLQYERPAQELVCKADKLAFPIRDGIPVMLESEAREISATGNASRPAASATAGAATNSTNNTPENNPQSPSGAGGSESDAHSSSPDNQT